MNRRVLSLGLLVSLWSPPAQAAVVLQYDLKELAAEATEVVHGRVVDHVSYWEGQVIVTEITVEVLECLKGAQKPDAHVVVLQPGGAVGDLAMVVPGAPRFTVGEEVVVFLEPSALVDRALVVGLAQGKFSVLTDPTSGKRTVHRHLGGLTRLDVGGRPGAEVDAFARKESVREQVRAGTVRLKFDDFMQELRGLLSGSK